MIEVYREAKDIFTAFHGKNYLGYIEQVEDELSFPWFLCTLKGVVLQSGVARSEVEAKNLIVSYSMQFERGLALIESYEATCAKHT